MFDCHLHSHFSSDSKADPREVISRAAADPLLDGICVTEHNDLDYPKENGQTVFALDLPAYVKTYEALRQEMQEGRFLRERPFTLLIGVEQGLQASAADKINAYDPDRKLDFIIGSSHLVNGQDPYYPSFWDGRSVERTLVSYFESVLDNLSVCRNFDVYGHLDYITRYIPKKTADFTLPPSCLELIDEILKELLDLGKGIEVNTAGYRYGGVPNPAPFVLKRYKELGGEIVTTGSDAHRPADIAAHFADCKALLQSLGFRYYTVFQKRKPYFRPL